MWYKSLEAGVKRHLLPSQLQMNFSQSILLVEVSGNKVPGSIPLQSQMWMEFHAQFPEHSTVPSWLDAGGREWSWGYIASLLHRWVLFTIRRSHSALLSTIMLTVNFRFASWNIYRIQPHQCFSFSSESCCTPPLLRPFGLWSLTPGPMLFFIAFAWNIAGFNCVELPKIMPGKLTLTNL